MLGRLAVAFFSSLLLHSSEKEERSQQALADVLGIQLLFWQLQRQGPNTDSAKTREAGSLSPGPGCQDEVGGSECLK